MNRLNYELKNLCKRNHDGAFATQKNRHNGLQLIADQLQAAGFQTSVMSVHDLKGRHISRLVSLWKQQALSDATMKNRLAMLRWWAEKIGNPGVVKTNEEYGISQRHLVTNESKAETLTGKDLSMISPWVALSLRLQEAFGLRREESMKFRVSWALKGQSPDSISAISLKPSWTKGGSLIPPDRSYREHLREFERQTSGIGIGHTHGLRHAYAQRRYEELTGRKPPVLGGRSRRTMRREERRKDDEIRQKISEELGHSRISVTSIYLGS